MDTGDLLAGMDIASGLASFGYGVFNSERNFRMQKENIDYQKKLQQQIFDREDNAMQRKIEDYKKAGFSPLQALSGVSGSGAGGVVNTSSPYADTPSYNGAMIDFLRQKNELKSQSAQIEGIEAENDIKEEQLKLLELEYEKQDYDFKKYKSANLPTTTKVSPMSIVGGYLGNNAQSIFKGIKGLGEYHKVMKEKRDAKRELKQAHKMYEQAKIRNNIK